MWHRSSSFVHFWLVVHFWLAESTSRMWRFGMLHSSICFRPRIPQPAQTCRNLLHSRRSTAHCRCPIWTARLPTCLAWQRTMPICAAAGLCCGLPGINMGRAVRNNIVPYRILPSRQLPGCWAPAGQVFEVCNNCSEWQLPPCRSSPGKAPVDAVLAWLPAGQVLGGQAGGD